MPEKPKEEKSRSEELLAALVLHQVYLTRVSGGIARDAVRTLNGSQTQVTAAIQRRLANNTGFSTKQSVRRFKALASIVRTARGNSWAQTTTLLNTQLANLATYHAQWMASTLASIGEVDAVGLNASTVRQLLRQPFQGRTIRDWLSRLAEDDQVRIENAIRTGMASGESAEVIARRFSGTQALKGRDGITQLTRSQVETLVRTGTAQVTADIDRELYRANRSIIAQEIYVAVLDSRTTPRCRSLSGNVYEVGEGPYPPQHFRCRSSRQPIFKGDEPPRVPSYSEWLRSQPAAVQNEILGPTRGRLFRSGDLELDRFVNRNGDQIPMRDLARLEAEAFEKAGIQIRA